MNYTQHPHHSYVSRHSLEIQVSDGSPDIGTCEWSGDAKLRNSTALGKLPARERLFHNACIGTYGACHRESRCTRDRAPATVQ